INVAFCDRDPRERNSAGQYRRGPRPSWRCHEAVTAVIAPDSTFPRRGGVRSFGEVYSPHHSEQLFIGQTGNSFARPNRKARTDPELAIQTTHFWLLPIRSNYREYLQCLRPYESSLDPIRPSRAQP